MPKETSAGAVVFRRENGKVLYLLLHYDAGHWDFPKGHVEKGESNRETVRRETEEETGIRELNFVEGFEEKISYYYKQDGKTIYKEVFFYLAETEEKRVETSFEHKGFEWLEFGDALERLTYDNAKEVLKKADKGLAH